jgi:glycosyltransferase involved in cell wall biosynthesis
MRILELVNTMSIGGAESMVASLALGLQDKGHLVHILCLRDLGKMTIPRQRFEDAGIQLVELKKNDGFSMECLHAIVNYCRRHQVQVIHAHTHQVNHYAVAVSKMTGISVVVTTMHGIEALRIQWWAKLLFRMTCLLTAKVVGVSQPVSEATIKEMRLTKSKLATIPNGVDLQEFQPKGVRPNREQFTFGTVARIVPVKNQKVMIEAFASIYRKHPNVRLEILGFGILQPELEALAQRLRIADAVVFHGLRVDIAAFLTQIDCFLLSSNSEGLPMTLLEAMASGLPVVSTAVGGIPAVVEESACGWLCPPGSPEEFAKAMDAALQARDLEERGKRARALVQRKYSSAVMADQYVELFQSFLPGTASAKLEVVPTSSATE